MDNTFILNNSIGQFELKDAIFERLSRIQSVTSCLLAGNSVDVELPDKHVYGVLWLIDDIVGEIECLFTRLDKITD